MIKYPTGIFGNKIYSNELAIYIYIYSLSLYIILYYIILYYVMLCYVILYYIILYCIILYYMLKKGSALCRRPLDLEVHVCGKLNDQRRLVQARNLVSSLAFLCFFMATEHLKCMHAKEVSK